MKRLLSLSIVAALMCCPAALAQSKPATTPGAPAQPTVGRPAPKGDAKPAAGQPDMKGMQEAWEKAGKPGKEHEAMKWFAGEWQAKVTEMGAEGTTTSEGTFVCEMTMGERFLSMDFKGRMMNKFFHGAGYMGYSNADKHYESVWMDSMGTSMLMMSGSVSADGKVWNFKGTTTDPVTGKPNTSREVWTITGKDTMKMEFFSDMGGKESKGMEILFTKGKKAEKKDDKKDDAPAPAKK